MQRFFRLSIINTLNAFAPVLKFLKQTAFKGQYSSGKGFIYYIVVKVSREMSVNPVSINNIDNKQRYQNINKNAGNVSFTGFNPVVGLMDIIESGGYAASFILQDGLGFVIPRVSKGIFRDSEKKDQYGNVIYKPNGKPERQYNWAYAKKEGIREVITGPSAFIIPLLALKGIKKTFGRANNVKLDYLDSFKKPFAEFASANAEALAGGTAAKTGFYERVFRSVIENTINSAVPDAEKLTGTELDNLAREFAQKQINIEAISADKSLSKKLKAQKIGEIGTVEDAFMRLKKGKIGGSVNELSLEMVTTNGKKAKGSIGELLSSMADYYDDASKTLKKTIKDKVNAKEIEELVAKFSNKRMGSRLLVNAGLVGLVAAFMTQIPKLYNLAWKDKKPKEDVTVETKQAGQPSFTGRLDILEKAGKKVFNSKNAKAISDIFELNGPVISGTAMPVVLYGFCIPPRLKHARDKYDYGEIVVRDLSSFTALLFGAKALARVFSDGFTRFTGLALHKKNLEGRNGFQKVLDYLNPVGGRHEILSTKQLTSKYTNIEEYKNGVDGFVEFIETSGGDVKKALSRDKNVKATVEKILKEFNGKAYADATSGEIKEALSAANKGKTKLIEEFYSLFKKENGLLSKSKTCNSAFGFLSTLVLVPTFIIWLAGVCERMTAKRTKHDNELAMARAGRIPSSRPTMEGFLGNR